MGIYNSFANGIGMASRGRFDLNGNSNQGMATEGAFARKYADLLANVDRLEKNEGKVSEEFTEAFKKLYDANKSNTGVKRVPYMDLFAAPISDVHSEALKNLIAMRNHSANGSTHEEALKNLIAMGDHSANGPTREEALKNLIAMRDHGANGSTREEALKNLIAMRDHGANGSTRENASATEVAKLGRMEPVSDVTRTADMATPLNDAENYLLNDADNFPLRDFDFVDIDNGFAVKVHKLDGMHFDQKLSPVMDDAESVTVMDGETILTNDAVTSFGGIISATREHELDATGCHDTQLETDRFADVPADMLFQLLQRKSLHGNRPTRASLPDNTLRMYDLMHSRMNWSWK